MGPIKYVLGALVGGLVLLVAGFVLYKVGFPDPVFLKTSAYEAAFSSPQNFWPIIVMEVLYALLMTIVFGRWASIKTFATGALAGAVIGALIGLAISFGLAGGAGSLDLQAALFAGLGYAIRFSLAGGVIGLLMK